MSKVLLKFGADWIGELYVSGWAIAEKAEWTRFVELNNQLEDIEVYFGTHQSFVWETWNDYIDNVSLVHIEENEAEILLEFFPNAELHFCFDNPYNVCTGGEGDFLIP